MSMQPMFQHRQDARLTVHHLPVSPGDEVAELVDGLCADQPAISPRFFYDQRGSALFDRITRTPEYYPTRTEAQIFARSSDCRSSRPRFSGLPSSTSPPSVPSESAAAV